MYGKSYSNAPERNTKTDGGADGGGSDYKRIADAKELLVICVKYRQNASLQGRVRGKLTKGAAVYFRSALELMRMINTVEELQDSKI